MILINGFMTVCKFIVSFVVSFYVLLIPCLIGYAIGSGDEVTIMDDYDKYNLIYGIIRAALVLLVCVGIILALLLLWIGAFMIINYILMI